MSVSDVPVVDPELCKPGNNEMYRRFQSFLNGGPRIVIPDQTSQQSSEAVNLQSPAKAEDPQRATLQFPCGARVEILNLQSKPELNGQVGVISAFEQTSGRYEVCLDDGQIKRVRSANLRPSSERPAPAANAVELEPGMLVQVDGIELGRREGSIIEYDDGTGEWQVLMSDGAARWVQPQSIKPLLGAGSQDGGGSSDVPRPVPPATANLGQGLHDGTRVQVVGLKLRPDVNGQCGTLVGFVSSEGRWQVRMDDGSGKTIAPENLQECLKSADSERPTAELAPGAQIRIKGLAIRPDLDGAEGRLISFDSSASRWVVDIGGEEYKLREENLDVICAAPTPSCAARPLSVTDVVESIRRMAASSGSNVGRADERFASLLAELRTLLVEQASPKEIVDVLKACEEFELQDPLLLDVLAQCTLEQVHRFQSHDLVQTVVAFAFAGHRSVALFDALATSLCDNLQDLCAREALLVAGAFARVRLRQFEMIDELASRAVVQLCDVGDEDLTRGVLAFQELEALDADLLAAFAHEVTQRSSRLTLSQVARLAQVLFRSAASQGLAAVVESTLREFEQVANRLIAHVDVSSLEPACIAALFDTFPGLRARLKDSYFSQVQQVVSLIRDSPLVDADGMRKLLEMFRTCALGSMGTRRMLADLGIRCAEPGFRRRAMNRLCWAAGYVEDWNVRTVPHRQFAFAEYDLTHQPQCKKVLEGELVCNDDEQTTLEEPLHLPGDGSLLFKGAEPTPLYALLTKFFALCSASCAEHLAVGIHIEGSIQVLLTKTPDLPGMLILMQIQRMFPKLVTSLSLVSEEQAEDCEVPSAPLDGISDAEVMDCELADEEVVEVQDFDEVVD